MKLLSVQGTGALWTIVLFLLCIVIVHAVRLALLGYRTLGKKLPPSPPPKQPEAEPVYYIVERKKKRVKSEFTDPKRFQFK